MNYGDVMNQGQYDPDEELDGELNDTDNIIEELPSDTSSDMTGEVSDGENSMVEIGDKVDPFTSILENMDTYETTMELHAAAIEDYASQQTELLQGIYINQLFMIGCAGAVLVVYVLYNFLRKFF